MTTLSSQIRLGIRVARLGTISSTILGIIKILSGILGNSSALIADGVESAADVFMSLVVWRGLRVSGRSATDEFHFGFGKAEPLAATVVSILVIGAGVALSITSIKEMLGPIIRPSWITLPILLLVIIFKSVLAKKVSVVGEEIESVSVKNEAVHHQTDALTSGAAFVGILIALIAGPSFYIADKIAAFFCAVIIIINGFRMFRASSSELMDKAPTDEFINQIAIAAKSVPEVTLVEKVLARKSGLAYFVDMHVHADPKMTLHDAHIVSGKVKTAVTKALPNVRAVLIHMEPDEESTLSR